MVLRVSRYNPVLTYVPGTKLPIADALSRSPQATHNIVTDDLDGPCVALHSVTALFPDAERSFKHATAADPDLQAVFAFVRNGWPAHHSSVRGRPGQHFWPIKEELHVADGLLYRGDRLVIPSAERQRVLKQLHNAHQGINTCIRKAKLHTFWPGMVADLETHIRQCAVCRTRDRANQQAPLQPHPIPPLPWHTVGMDLYHGRKPTLLLVDYHSKFVEIEELSCTTAPAVIAALKPHFARYGNPTKAVTDNGPPFNSQELASFFRDRGVLHVTSSPHYPRSNGMVERHIQTVKNLMEKALLSGQDPYVVLLEYRTTPMYNMPAPSQALMGRLLRSPNTTSTNTLQPSFPIAQNIARLCDRQNQMKHYADRRASASPASALPVGSAVRHWVSNRNWQPATIVALAPEPDSYVIKTSAGRLLRRNRHHLRPSLSISADDVPPQVLSPGSTHGSVPNTPAADPSCGMRIYVAPSHQVNAPATPSGSALPFSPVPLPQRTPMSMMVLPPPMGQRARVERAGPNQKPNVFLPREPPPPFTHSPIIPHPLRSPLPHSTPSPAPPVPFITRLEGYASRGLA